MDNEPPLSTFERALMAIKNVLVIITCLVFLYFVVTAYAAVMKFSEEMNRQLGF